MDKAFEKQITDLEMQFWRAMKDKDASAATRLTAGCQAGDPIAAKNWTA